MGGIENGALLYKLNLTNSTIIAKKIIMNKTSKKPKFLFLNYYWMLLLILVLHCHFFPNSPNYQPVYNKVTLNKIIGNWALFQYVNCGGMESTTCSTTDYDTNASIAYMQILNDSIIYFIKSESDSCFLTFHFKIITDSLDYILGQYSDSSFVMPAPFYFAYGNGGSLSGDFGISDDRKLRWVGYEATYENRSYLYSPYNGKLPDQICSK